MPIAETVAGTATAFAATATTIDISMPYTVDEDADNTYTVDYKLASATTWTNWVLGAAHTASPYTDTITGLTSGASYDVRLTYNDTGGITGINPQINPGSSVVWTDLAGVTADGGTLFRTTVGGWGGGASVQTIAGDGAVEFIPASKYNYSVLGLSYTNTDAGYGSINYAIYAGNKGRLYVYENGVQQGGTFGYGGGSILRVERVGGTVVYKHNGSVFYTSTIPSTGTLIGDAALSLPAEWGPYMKIENARIEMTLL